MFFYVEVRMTKPTPSPTTPISGIEERAEKYIKGYGLLEIKDAYLAGAQEQAPISFADGRAAGYEEGVRAVIELLRSDEAHKPQDVTNLGSRAFASGLTWADWIEARLLNQENDKRE